MTPLPPPPPLSLSLSLSRHTHTQSSMIRLHCALAYRSHVPRHPDIVTNRRRYGDCCLCTRVDGVIAVQGRATHAQRSTCSAVVLCFIDAAIRRSRLRVMTVAAAVNITKWDSTIANNVTRNIRNNECTTTKIFTQSRCWLHTKLLAVLARSASQYWTFGFFWTQRHLYCTSYLHYTLPDKRDSFVTDELRNPKIFGQLPIKTDKLSNSFIPHCLDRYQ